MTSLSNPFARLVDSIRGSQRLLSKGTSLTITSSSVIAQMGEQTFVLSENPYELQADLEAFHRLSARRRAHA